MEASLDNYAEYLAQVSIRDERRLAKDLAYLQSRKNKNLPFDKKLDSFKQHLTKALDKVTLKAQSCPQINFPENLPISQKREEIADSIKNNQVVVLAGETGSGKTTQIPKICMSLGRGIRGRIGHTQPRRIAARTVANRIAEELGVALGSAVGYQIRFNDDTNENTFVKLMTDGILLAEIQHDPLLLSYDTIIIDEAHERSLNIDFLLGYLKNILPKRPDLKIIITSATIDLERFSKHFNNAPILEVSGRTYPVETVYRPWQDIEEDQNSAIVSAVDEILTHYPRGDVLIFMSGERDIREASHALKKANFKHLEILPLYARLSIADQNKIFHGHKGQRVVLATNVAETSVTVPGIKYVIDPGYARISRYSYRTKVQRLPIEAISQASANQRKGRCGRTSDGVCFRLYEEDDFKQRAEFTDPEIQRTNLASVILQMLNMRIGDIRKFPFVDAPDSRMISDGFKLLEEVKAVNSKGNVTALGRQLSALPIDPRLGAVVTESAKQGCLKEILIIVAALSIQDPRERPADKKQAADEKHRRFADESSDFSAYLNLWNYFEEQRQELSQSQLRRLCQKEFINFLRMREWRDLHHQLKLSTRQMGIHENTSDASYNAIHKSLVSGYLSQIGLRDKEKGSRDYFGTRQKKFMIFPGSSQNKKKHQWVLAAEFIETSQLFGHCVAKIEPEWVLELGDHLSKKHYSEPHYDVKTGQVRAYLRTTLLGLVLQDKQRVAYAHIDPGVATDVFIREALVEGKYRGKGAFFQRNQKVLEEIHELEAKSRRRDILVDDEVIFEFYKQRLPLDIANLKAFEFWRKKAEQENPKLLYLSKETLMLHNASSISDQQFPNHLNLGDYTLEVQYQFEPGKRNDGVNLLVPVDILYAIQPEELEWTVPGVRRDKCIALLKALPKSLRKNFVPVPEYVDKVFSRLQPSVKKLSHALGEALSHISETKIPEDAWDETSLDDFYRVNIQVVDEKNQIIDQSRDIHELREKYRSRVQRTISRASDSLESTNVKTWNFGQLENTVTLDKGRFKIKAYPAVVPQADSVDIKVLDNPEEAKYLTRHGLLRLASLECSQIIKLLKKSLLKGKDIGLTQVNVGPKGGVIDDIILAGIYEAVFKDKPLPTNAQEFDQLLQQGKSDIASDSEAYAEVLVDCLALVVKIRKKIKESKNALVIALAVKDIEQQIQALMSPHFLLDTSINDFKEYPRYLEAILIRLEKVPQNVNRDLAWTKSLNDFWKWHEDRLEKEGRWSYMNNKAWQDYRWMLEELRVSLFAQTLKTRVPVSEKRMKKQWELSLG